MSFPPEVLAASRCSVQERIALLSLLTRFGTFAGRARREGILSLEDYIGTAHTPFLAAGLTMLVDGYKSQVLDRFLLNVVLTSGFTGRSLLEQLLIAEGLSGIAHGMNPPLIRSMQLSLLGEEFLHTDLDSGTGIPSPDAPVGAGEPA